MKTDRYTKVVLTVIALCLVWLCAIGTPAGVFAQQASLQGSGSAVPVIVVGTGTMARDGQVTVAFENGHTRPTLPVTLPYSQAAPLPVSLPYSEAKPMPSRLFYTPQAPMPVEISAVRKSGEWEPIRTSIEDAPYKKKPGLGQ